MRSISVAVPDDLADALAVEADLLDFPDRESYVQWLLAERLALDLDTDRGAMLAAYAERLAAETDAGDADDVPSRHGFTGGDLEAPVERRDDPAVDAAAAALSTVERDRVDEFVGRAVADTREQLGDGVDTGVDYRSDRRLDEDARPGEELTDLDALDVPGHDEALLERRRDAVGAALAFLKAEGEARRGDFVDALYQEFSAGYESADSWWECVKRGLRQVDRVRAAHEDRRVWSYRSTPGRVTTISFS